MADSVTILAGRATDLCMAIGNQQGITATAASVDKVQVFVAVRRLQSATGQGDGWCCRVAL